MNAVNSYCSHCGFLLQSDCDFCPSCGSAKSKSNQSRQVTTEPHAWMKDSPVSPGPLSRPPAQTVVAPQIQYVPYAVPAPAAGTQDPGFAGTVRTMGIIAISLMLIGFIPCLGWLNYLNLTLSFITVILCIVALASAKTDHARSSALVGLGLVVVAICAGIGRLILGGGCL